LKNPVRKFREALGVSRTQLAVAIGKSPQILEKYEAEPSAEIIQSLERYAASIGRPDAIPLLDPEITAHQIAATTAAAPPADAIPFPGILSDLSDDDVWLVHQLVNILRDRPQGDIFHLLETTLQKAARAYVAAPQGKPAKASRPSPRIVRSTQPRSGPEVPESVLNVLHNTASDPDFQQCILALGEIWAAGDLDARDSIIRNCRTFARLAMAVKRIQGGKPDRVAAPGSADFQGRVESLLEDAKRIEREPDLREREAPPPERGGPGVEPLETGNIRKTGGRRRNRG